MSVPNGCTAKKHRLGKSMLGKRTRETHPNAPVSSQVGSADEPPPKRRIEDARMLLRALPHASSTEDATQLYVLPNWVVDDKRVVVLFRCEAMRKTLQQYPGECACISVDRKEKCLQNG